MASPPALSPLNLTLPRKRPLGPVSPSLPNQPGAKRRKPSIHRAPSSTHQPSHLRQTSFPPDDADLSSVPGSAALSPGMTPRSREMSIDSLPSAALGSIRSGKGGGKRRVTLPPDLRSEKSGRTKKSASGTGAGYEGEEEEEGEEGEGEEEVDGAPLNVAYEGLSELTEAEEKRNRAILATRMENLAGSDHAARFTAYVHAAPKKDLVKKLVNQTLSQSVTAPVLTTVQGAIRVFASELIDTACTIRREWQVAASTLPSGKSWQPGPTGVQEAKLQAVLPNDEPYTDDTPIKLRKLEMYRGPLTPDHLREAMRRMKKERDGALPGMLGLSLAGLEYSVPRTNGRRLFK